MCGARSIWKISVPSQFHCKPKTVLKNSFFLNKLLENIQIKYREKKVENTEKKHTTHIRNVFRIVEEEERRKTYVEKNNI